MQKSIVGLAAAFATITLAGCGGAPAETVKSLVASCVAIDEFKPAVCECQVAVLADNMEAKDFEIYSVYRAAWAANNSAYNAVELGENTAMEKFQISRTDITKISNEAALKYRSKIKDCETAT
jgi:hypothetical protein